MRESTKHKIRNPKQVRRTRIRMTQTLSPVGRPVLDFGFLSFVLVSNFVFRVSDFPLAGIKGSSLLMYG
jgi:hypothetical protein